MADSPVIWPSVRRTFLAFSVRFEGAVAHLYPDIKGLITIAVGVLCDPVEMALGLPLQRADGQPATRGEIAAEWWLVKTRADPQAGARAARPLCLYSLSPHGIEAVTLAKLDQMIAALHRRFPDLPAWPASAQLAVLSLAWACGAGFAFPKTEAAIRRQDWTTAAAEGVIRTEGNPGVVGRNHANRKLFLAAAHQQATGADPSVLLWEPPAAPALDRGAVLAQLDLSLRTSTGKAIEEALADRRREGDG